MSLKNYKHSFLFVLLASIIASAQLVPGPSHPKPDPWPSPSPDPRPAPYPDPRPAPYPDPTPDPTPTPTPWPDPTPTPWPDPTPTPWPDPTPTPWPDPTPTPWPDPTPTPWPDPTPTPWPDPTPTPPANQVRTVIVNEIVQDSALDLVIAFRLQKPELQNLVIEKITGEFNKYDSNTNQVELVIDGKVRAKAVLVDSTFELKPKKEFSIGGNFKTMQLRVKGKVYLQELSVYLK